jgi:two-component system CAI-1 autoinducer sensor kinase/phosphatase CqsS
MFHYLQRLRAKLDIRQTDHWNTFIEQTFLSPVQWLVEATSARLMWLGAFVMVLNPFFYWIFTYYAHINDNFLARAILCTSGLLVLLTGFSKLWKKNWAIVFLVLMTWFQLPVFSLWMYLANDGLDVWLATSLAFILIFHIVTDWRVASIGTLLGYLVVGVLWWSLEEPPTISETTWVLHLIMLIFVWSSAIMLNISSASRRQKQLADTLATIGIMAHELRTPLSAIALVADALELNQNYSFDEPLNDRLQDLANRTRELTQQMHHQIDTQIANARLLKLPTGKDIIVASQLIEKSVSHYPYITEKERQCVKVTVYNDFEFIGSHNQMRQVIDNLIKNAITSLYKANSQFESGSISILVNSIQEQGIIQVSDKGVGIDPLLQRFIFSPFFSTNQRTGHGLGLAFCKRVLSSTKGQISVLANYSGQKGAQFLMTIPLLNPVHKQSSQGEPK